MEPINPNPHRPNKNTLALAMTGAGKSQALSQSGFAPGSGVRHFLYDPAHDHELGTVYVSSLAKYIRVAVKFCATGRGFRLAYDGRSSIDNFDTWCRCVWALLDGKKETYCTVEDMEKLCPGAGQATEYHHLLWTEGRKYGLVYGGTSQTPQGITKNAYDNTKVFYIGQQVTRNAKKFADEFDLDRDNLKTLPALSFWRIEPQTPNELIRFRYLKGKKS